jgi:hypothetical protein
LITPRALDLFNSMGLEFELLLSSGQLSPIRTAATTTRPDGDEKNAAVVVDGCSTPTSSANVLRAPSVCPPAPRKPRPAAKRKLHHLSGRCHCGPAAAAPQSAPPVRRWFIAVPYDVLAAAFVARKPSAPCRPPAGKKIRVHAVG